MLLSLVLLLRLRYEGYSVQTLVSEAIVRDGSPKKATAVAAESETFEIVENELVPLNLFDLALSHCIPPLRTPRLIRHV